MPKIMVPAKLADKIEARAKERGLTVERFLDEVFAADMQRWKLAKKEGSDSR